MKSFTYLCLSRNYNIVEITGGSTNSLGVETVISLALASPATIVLLGRTESKVTTVLEKIKALSPSISAFFIPINLSSPSSIKDAAPQVLREISQIDVLMNSVGIMAPPKYSTFTYLQDAKSRCSLLPTTYDTPCSYPCYSRPCTALLHHGS